MLRGPTPCSLPPPTRPFCPHSSSLSPSPRATPSPAAGVRSWNTDKQKSLTLLLQTQPENQAKTKLRWGGGHCETQPDSP